MWKRIFGRQVTWNYPKLALFSLTLLSMSAAISFYMKRQQVKTSYVPVVKERIINRHTIDSLMEAREQYILDSVSRQVSRLRREVNEKNRTIHQLIKRNEASRKAYDSVYIDRPVF